ncbi:DUF3368 domain-containing protein [Desulfonatronum thioautotrophicum]|uniref:DUF3368 domain-containing protein n=1 Tax=Desulfonatronum thioautotrophicum TaxID=617001 RepID=UPI0005EBE151|nr:DUF3368 domain-containing protein [Desulfonatronum thioautotrophicum]
MAERRWVINASPLILLGKVNLLDLLPRITSDLLIPPAVVEVVQGGLKDDPARNWLSRATPFFMTTAPALHPTVAAWNLGKGETEVISYAVRSVEYTVIIDDLAARNCALSMGVSTQGTLGVLLLLKKDGLLERVMPFVEDLQSRGMRIDSSLVARIGMLAGEDVG